MQNRMKRLAGLVVVSVGAGAVSGCLHMETAHRLYLSPGGEVSWTVQQSDVRSDTEDPGRRREEEERFLLDSEAGANPVALAFQALRAGRVRTDVLRPVRPFVVATTADFERVDEMANRLLGELHLEGRATLTRSGGQTTLAIMVRVPEKENDVDTAVTALLEDLPRYRMVLTAGRFVAAEGFALSADGAVATPVAPETLSDEVRLTLTWRE
jgi:hypothetical protein